MIFDDNMIVHLVGGAAFIAVAISVLLWFKRVFCKDEWEMLLKAYKSENAPENTRNGVGGKIGNFYDKTAFRIGWTEDGIFLGALRPYRWQRDAILIPWDDVRLEYDKKDGGHTTQIMFVNGTLPVIRVDIYVDKGIQPDSGPNANTREEILTFVLLMAWMISFMLLIATIVSVTTIKHPFFEAFEPYVSYIWSGFAGITGFIFLSLIFVNMRKGKTRSTRAEDD